MGRPIVKLAFKATTPKMKVEEHHSAEEKDWKKFEKNVRSRGFVELLKADPRTDAKLSHYASAMHEYKSSKKVVASVPSRSKYGKSYKVKRLPDGRLGCGCKDWQFKHSHMGTDCEHIKKVKGMEKAAAALHPFVRGLQYGVRVTHGAAKNLDRWEKGTEAKERGKK